MLGDVRTPGNFRLMRGSDVLNAIALAGGTNESYDQLTATLQRDGRVTDLDLTAIAAGDKTANLSLQSGDTISDFAD